MGGKTFFFRSLSFFFPIGGGEGGWWRMRRREREEVGRERKKSGEKRGVFFLRSKRKTIKTEKKGKKTLFFLFFNLSHSSPPDARCRACCRFNGVRSSEERAPSAAVDDTVPVNAESPVDDDTATVSFLDQPSQSSSPSLASEKPTASTGFHVGERESQPTVDRDDPVVRRHGPRRRRAGPRFRSVSPGRDRGAERWRRGDGDGRIRCRWRRRRRSVTVEIVVVIRPGALLLVAPNALARQGPPRLAAPPFDAGPRAESFV